MENDKVKKVRSSKPQRIKRLDLVFKALVAGKSEVEIVAHYAKEWNVTRAAVWHYVREVQAENIKEIDANREAIVADNYSRLLNIYDKSLANGCFSAAVTAVKEINSMFGARDKKERPSRLCDGQLPEEQIRQLSDNALNEIVNLTKGTYEKRTAARQYEKKD